VHNYNFDIAGDGQLYSTMEDLLRWDNYLHGAEKPAIYPMMLVEGKLNNGERIDYAQGLRREEYRGLHTIGHGGSSWGFRTELIRFTEPGLSIAISCNMGDVNPQYLAKQVADHYLATQLNPSTDEEGLNSEAQVTEEIAAQPELTTDQLAEFAGSYFAPELDATYRFEVVDGGLFVHIEQDPLLEVVAVSDDRFEVVFHPAGWMEADTIGLEFDRNRAGTITGFDLGLGSERGIVFERR
jgi:hypothetical protein